MPSSHTNVIALRLRALGDVLATLDALRAMKKADPDREITYVVDRHYHPLVENEPYIDRVLPSPPKARGLRGLLDYFRYVRRLRRLKAGVVLDFHSNTRSAFLTWLSGAKIRVGYDVKIRKAAYNIVVPRGGAEVLNSAESAMKMASHAGAAPGGPAVLPEMTVDPPAIEQGARLLADAGFSREDIAAGLVVGFNPGIDRESRSWPVAHFVELARTLVSRGRQVAVLWGPGERDVAERIAAVAGEGVRPGPDASLAALPGLVRNLGYLVTTDSGLKHLAVRVRVPTVTIVGSTSPHEWHIGTDRDGFLWKEYSCSPCRLDACPIGAPCLSDIRPAEVLEELYRLGLESDGGKS
jgi:ADP-heptose:LPS heptosyltransferase